MFDRFWSRIPPPTQMISVRVYRLTLLVVLVLSAIVFSAADNTYCTTTAAIAVGKDEALGCFEYWLNRYQSLIGGILALAGAALAFAAVRAQIDQTERHAQERRMRVSNAARSVLPPALSNITDYASGCIQQLALLRVTDPGHNLTDLVFPRFPEEAIEVCKQAVEFADANKADEFADLIAHLQIQAARLRELREDSRTRFVRRDHYRITSLMYDAVDLHARAGRLFDYARRFMDDSLVENSDFLNSMSIHDLRGDDWPLHERVVARPVTRPPGSNSN